MAKGKGGNTVAIVTAMAEPLAEQLGLILWDVCFEKEGSMWYLRILLDKEEGIDIQDCEAFSRAINPMLDEADPIDQSYTLEVSSAGIERELTKPAHFAAMMGYVIRVRTIREFNGEREFIGELTGYEDGRITIVTEEETEITFEKNETAYVKLYFDFDHIGGFEQ